MLLPFLLQLYHLQPFEQVAPTLEIVFQGAHQQTLSEAARTAKEIDVAACQPINQLSLVNIDISALADCLEVLYTNRIVHHGDLRIEI